MGIINFIERASISMFNKMFMDQSDPIDIEIMKYVDNHISTKELNKKLKPLRKMTKPSKGKVVETHKNFKVLSVEEL